MVIRMAILDLQVRDKLSGTLMEKWLIGLSLNIGWTKSNSITLELWVIRFGLNVAWEIGQARIYIRNLFFSSINHSIWLTTNKTFPPLLTNLVYECKRMMYPLWQVIIRHIYKEANRCVNLLTAVDNRKQNYFVTLVPLFWLNPQNSCSSVDLLANQGCQ